MDLMTLDADRVMLDLVAHFLGIAEHDNINAAPSALAAGTTRADSSKGAPSEGCLAFRQRLAWKPAPAPWVLPHQAAEGWRITLLPPAQCRAKGGATPAPANSDRAAPKSRNG